MAGPRLVPRAMEERGLVHESGNLSVAGALVLTDPAVTLDAAKFRVDLRVYESDSGTSYINRELVSGPVQTSGLRGGRSGRPVRGNRNGDHRRPPPRRSEAAEPSHT